MSKVLLINPPQKYYRKSSKFSLYLPVGLLSVGAKIKAICSLMIFDCAATNFRKKKEEDYFLYGTPFNEIESKIRDFKPEIVGISVLSATQLATAVAVSNLCKKINPLIKTVFGGPDPSVRYAQLLENDDCDFCVIGEGEETFYEFIEKFNQQLPLTEIDGLAYKINGKLNYRPRKFIDRLDSLPFPAYELINLSDYYGNRYFYNMRSQLKENSLPIITSRGCPYGCIFCSVHLHLGHEYRWHTPEYVINHLKYCINNFQVNRFHFEDDNISLNKERFEGILDRIIQEGLKIEWDAPNGVRADTLDYNLLTKMKLSGCRGMAIGIESGNQEILNNLIKKNTSLTKIIEVAEYCQKLKIKLLGFYVIGFPGETKQDIQETIELALKLLNKFDVNPALLMAVPLYGTQLYNICVEKGLIPEKLNEYDLSVACQPHGNPMIATEHFTRADLKKMISGYNARLVFQLINYHLRLLRQRPKYFLQKLNFIHQRLKPQR